jgi:two-component system NarL family sensor kinase
MSSAWSPPPGAPCRSPWTGALQLEIADNGDGLPDAFRAGVGISSMRERAAELGGHCSVEALVPHGTRVRATIPLEIR